MKTFVAVLALMGFAAGPVMACEWMKTAEKDQEVVKLDEAVKSEPAAQSKIRTDRSAGEPGRVQLSAESGESRADTSE